MPHTNKSMPVLAFLLCVGLFQAAQAASCAKNSPAHRVALFELYTSEGCSSCPPADRWLAELSQRFSAEQLVALSLHVDYWDYIGWQDPFAQPHFSERQRWLTGLAGGRTVYTPEVFAGMKELRGWRQQATAAEQIQSINRQPARADISLQMRPGRDKDIELEARFALKEEQRERGVEGIVVLYENHLVSAVGAGENTGSTLRHERVVRFWSPPVTVNASSGQTLWRQTLRLPGNWQRGNLGVAAFVQDPHAGEVLQAVAMPGCA